MRPPFVVVLLILAGATAAQPASAAGRERWTTHRLPESQILGGLGGPAQQLEVRLPATWAPRGHDNEWNPPGRTVTARVAGTDPPQVETFPSVGWRVTTYLPDDPESTLQKVRHEWMYGISSTNTEEWWAFLIGDMFLPLGIGRVWRGTWVEWTSPFDGAGVYVVWPEPMILRQLFVDRAVVRFEGTLVKAFYVFHEFCLKSLCPSYRETFKRIRQSLRLVPRRGS